MTAPPESTAASAASAAPAAAPTAALAPAAGTASSVGAPDYDLAIVGGGPAGSAAALLIAAHHPNPERILVLDRQTEAQACADPRVLALSAGSLQILARIAPVRELAAANIAAIHVSQAGHFGRTRMLASEHGVDALGQVVRYGELMRVLGAALAHSGVSVRRPVAVQACAETPEAVEWTDDGAGTGRAALLVHAEGGLFERAPQTASAPGTRLRDYGQTALIGEIACDRPQPGTAFERFAAHGPIALLPLPERARYALVWCERPERAAELAALSEADFLAELQRAFGERLGRFTGASARHAYALGLARHADAPGARRIARIGNAAQALHPVAGQGLNLGLRDAHALAAAYAQAGPTPEAIARLRAARRLDRAATVRITDAFARGFALPFAPLRHLAGAGLFALDLAAPLRRALARQMMFGVRD